MSAPETPSQSAPSDTPIEVIANVTRVVTRVVDRIMGDRSDYPLMVAAACVEALKTFDIAGRVFYGQAAWIEVLEDHTVLWAGCWGKSLHFWVGTAYGEVVDLNTSVAHRKRAHDNPGVKSIYSPPLLWSREVPRFYRYVPEGVAEIELLDPEDQRKYDRVVAEILEKCGPKHLMAGTDLDFPNEALLCPGRKLLDDSKDSFKHFDRALAVQGIPPSPLT